MPAAQRVDAALVARGLSVSRTAARKAIEAGRVSLRRVGHPDFLRVGKASIDVFDADELTVQAAEEDAWVSRGALKLIGALDQCGIDVAGLHALDVGQSTGGFTDVLLARGAKRVVGVDVGHGQLHPRLGAHPDVRCIEGFNARDISRQALEDAVSAHGDRNTWIPSGGFDLIVMDVSFISLLKISSGLKTLMSPAGHGLWLVKPQFEVGPAHIGKGGIVKAEALGPEFENGICQALRQQGLSIKQFMPSPIAGGDGNREYFVWVSPESA